MVEVVHALRASRAPRVINRRRVSSQFVIDQLELLKGTARLQEGKDLHCADTLDNDDEG
jgi:hypothetical protein